MFFSIVNSDTHKKMCFPRMLSPQSESHTHVLYLFGRKVTARRATTTWWWTSPTRYNELFCFRNERKKENPKDKIHLSALILAPARPAAGSGVSQRESCSLASGKRIGQEPPDEEGGAAESVLRRLLQQHAYFQIQRD